MTLLHDQQTSLIVASEEPIESDDYLSDLSTWERVKASKIALYVARLIVFLIVFALWQLCSNRAISSYWISSPGAVFERIGHWLADGYLQSQLWVTLEEAGLGFVVGAVIGSVLGIGCGYFRAVGSLIEPLILAVYSMPVVALAPLFILWFGIGEESKIFLSATTVVAIVFFNCYTGLKEVDQELVDSVRIMGGKRRHVLWKVIMPDALTWVFLGFKVALPFALIGAVVGELVSSSHGIGYIMSYSISQFDTTGVFVGLFVIATVSLIIGGLLRGLESVVLRWKPGRS